MKQLLLTFILILLQSISFAQVKTAGLSKLRTIAQAQEFIKSNPAAEAELFSIHPDQDLAGISPQVFTKKPGYTFKVGDHTYKIITVDSLRSFRVSYIFLNGNRYPKAEADKIREEIISKYKSGIKFTDLVKEYNMDGNATGDTNWFVEKAMVAEFENAVKAHGKGDIFTVDTPGQNWYHVVLKTHKDTYVKELTILKAKTGR